MSNFNPEIPYTVPPIPTDGLKGIEMACAKEIKQAHIAIAKLDGFLSGIPQSQIMLINPIYLKEALESSEIENINTTLLDVLEQQLNPKGKKENSQLVVNYFLALRWGRDAIHKLGLSNRLIVGLQERLMPDGATGYRRLQVYIGDGRGTVRYTPPASSELSTHITRWEKLVNGNKSIDPLVLAAAGHYMFEAIHPFEDGNGRTGRMLLTLQLVDAGLLSSPIVHISQYINKNRSDYYRLLRDVTAKGELEEFVKYITRGFAVQAEHSLSLLQQLKFLQETFQHKIKEELHYMYSNELVEQLFINPVQTPARLSEELKIHRLTASKYLRLLAEKGFLSNTKRGRNMFYVNEIMLDALSDHGKLQDKK